MFYLCAYVCFNRLVKLSDSLQISLAEHTNDIQELQRQFRQNLEMRFEGLREANAQLMKHFKYVCNIFLHLL